MLKFDFNILWTLINLILLFVLMKLFLFKPIKKTLDKRRELIDNQFKDANEKEKSALELYSEYQSQLDGVEDEKKEILIEARENAKTQYNKIMERAQSDADKLKADAKRASELESEKARLMIKEEIAELAMKTAEKIIGDNAGVQTDSNIYDEFLSEGSDD